uniref:Uncharacterized protein n=2 Tax=Palpitomonas bilix TaxID=652834 RepID=A0A7S3DGQ3_9EUKA|mmetsp:Transcript_37061/g.96057  ORF Transcript_37061/g.96057 Transcript_37061/m.96057 type:complete len:126 (+) Transcript_37061:260-637(+)
MMVEELGIMPPDDADSPIKNGLVTFGSFVAFGIVPLAAYLVVHAIIHSDPAYVASFNWAFLAACIITALSLFGMGALKGRISGTSWWKSGFHILVNGALAAGSAYLIGWGVEYAVESTLNVTTSC